MLWRQGRGAVRTSQARTKGRSPSMTDTMEGSRILENQFRTATNPHEIKKCTDEPPHVYKLGCLLSLSTIHNVFLMPLHVKSERSKALLPLELTRRNISSLTSFPTRTNFLSYRSDMSHELHHNALLIPATPAMPPPSFSPFPSSVGSHSAARTLGAHVSELSFAEEK
jgi:hypothetical protein